MPKGPLSGLPSVGHISDCQFDSTFVFHRNSCLVLYNKPCFQCGSWCCWRFWCTGWFGFTFLLLCHVFTHARAHIHYDSDHSVMTRELMLYLTEGCVRLSGDKTTVCCLIDVYVAVVLVTTIVSLDKNPAPPSSGRGRLLYYRSLSQTWITDTANSAFQLYLTPFSSMRYGRNAEYAASCRREGLVLWLGRVDLQIVLLRMDWWR